MLEGRLENGSSSARDASSVVASVGDLSSFRTCKHRHQLTASQSGNIAATSYAKWRDSQIGGPFIPVS